MHHGMGHWKHLSMRGVRNIRLVSSCRTLCHSSTPVLAVSGGFWITYGIIIQPTFALAASFAPASDVSNGITAAAAGSATRAYNAGLGTYFLVWGMLCVIYFIAALRTYDDLSFMNITTLTTQSRNVPFAIIFLCKSQKYGSCVDRAMTIVHSAYLCI